jgi:hypothetical protein
LLVEFGAQRSPQRTRDENARRETGHFSFIDLRRG